VFENARRLNALVVLVEHRYYGEQQQQQQHRRPRQQQQQQLDAMLPIGGCAPNEPAAPAGLRSDCSSRDHSSTKQVAEPCRRTCGSWVRQATTLHTRVPLVGAGHAK
jgi:hypothetical protein